jgi:hypothetical protein
MLTGGMANANHLIGALIVTITVVALAETVRFLRFINMFFALALFITPFIYSASMLSIIASIICGILLFIVSIPRGKIRSSYGIWDKFII